MTDIVLPCESCTACCRGPMRAVVIHPDENHARWETKPLGDLGYRILANEENGDCVYITDAGCSIWDDRPRDCRRYDCRVEMDRLDEHVAKEYFPLIHLAAALLRERMAHAND